MPFEEKPKAASLQCEKCGKTMSEINFYNNRQGVRSKICKSCLLMHVNNFDPSTYLWILEKLDFPYIEEEWNAVRDKEWAKNPDKFGPMSVMGKYISKMRLRKFGQYGYADSQKIIDEANENKQRRWEEKKQQYEVQKGRLESGEISEAEFRTLVDTEFAAAEYEKEVAAGTVNEQSSVDKLLKEAFDKRMRETEIKVNGEQAVNNYRDQKVIGSNNYFNENNYLTEEDLDDPAANLSKEDKLYLAMKWGRLYKPNEWIELEKKYKEMEHSFDIEDSDTISSLVLICKTYLKMNQALDTNDLEGYSKLSRTYDQLRKSAKFTAVQKEKDIASNFIDCVGNLVVYCEKEGGAIPRYDISIDYDVLDKEINNMKNYTKTLFYGDPAIARQIEDYVKRRSVAEDIVDNEVQNGSDAVIELEEDDYRERFEQKEQEKEHDDKINEGGYDL